ncbi:S-adenosyl-L-methionine-dependent methyltransferase [Coprinopsis sp. MPI-PUGE-AT-0042]|nr:S-adenosyl-L-methionine-dependent methyltransferase [Coprinopsis sp. MPI-PUGE-AT-0042]
MTIVHQVAQTGFGEGTNELYDRIRPSYQPWALSRIRSVLRNNAPFKIAEIGAGTGIFTRAILNHPEWSNAIEELRAIEPSEGMRNTFSDRVQDPRVSISDGTFDTTHLPDAWADLVVIAQAFHWCPDFDKASAEFSRILKPGGTVAFIWNLEDRGAADWVGQIRDLIEAHEKGTPQFRQNLWRQCFETASYKEAFQTPDEQVKPYYIEGTEQGAVDRASSKSYIAILPPDEKGRVQQTIREIVRRGDGLEWIDKEKGVFKYPYQTWLVVSQKK